MKPKFTRIFLIAFEYEVENYFKGVPLKEYDESSSTNFRLRTTLDDKNLIVLTGISKTNAAAATQFVIDHFDADQFINIGLVGAINPDLKIGDVVEVSVCRFHDVDVTAFNYEIGQIPNTEVSSYPLHLLNNLNIPAVNLITGDRFVSDQSLFPKEIMALKPDIVEMETAAIAHVFYVNKMLDKFSSIRTVSDKANSDSKVDLYKNPEMIFNRTSEVVKKILLS